MSQNWVIQVVILPGQFQDLVSVAGLGFRAVC